jgi:hypothetical protein
MASSVNDDPYCDYCESTGHTFRFCPQRDDAYNDDSDVVDDDPSPNGDALELFLLEFAEPPLRKPIYPGAAVTHYLGDGVWGPRPACPACSTMLDEDGYCHDVGCRLCGKTPR